MNNTKSTYFILLAIIVLAGVLRFRHIHALPFINDELSALIRTEQPDFHNEIVHGVMADTHPAGVQLFLYYWTKIVGYSEPAVKLPFIICGILSVLLIALLAKEWFNSTVAFVCASFLATIEYAVMYSQLARPYSSGLFLTLAMVWFWNKAIFKPNKKYYFNLFMYILLSALCAYNHHFSLLVAAMVGVTGLFFVRGKHMVNYIIAGVCIFLLYIPHLHIFFYQLHKGGIGEWLGKPKNTFIIQYLKYIFQYSTIIYLAVAILIVAGLISTLRLKRINSPYYLISVSWFLFPFLAGFFYSKYFSPVLQYSCLIFSFPFLLFTLFGLLPELKPRVNLLLVILICSINTYALVNERNYYTLFYTLHNERQVVINDSISKKFGNSSLIALAQSNPDSITSFYFRKYKINIPYTWVPDSAPKQKLINCLENHKTPYLTYDYIVGSNPVYLPIILNYYPGIILANYSHEGTNYVFSSMPSNGNNPYIFEHRVGFDTAYRMDSLHEWAPDFSSELGKITHSKNDLILVSINLYPLENLDDVIIVSSVESKDSTLLWRGTAVSNFLMKDSLKKWQKAYHMLDLSGFNSYTPDLKVKIYIWNKGKKNFYMNDFKVTTLPGNPVLFSLWEKI